VILLALYAISDLHLSFGVDKPMNIFGKVWKDYEKKLEENWRKQVLPEDTVVIAGDISWGIDFDEAKKDFEFINSLPGTKLILRGNHDYYFSTKTKVEKFLKDNDFSNIKILHNNAIAVDEYIVCGTRGWGLTENNTKEEEEKMIAPCGMNCALCYAHLREKDKCPGCRSSGVNFKYCKKCIIRNCENIEKGSNKYCYGCVKYPCSRLKALDKRYRNKYNMSMLENLNEIKTKGINTFLDNQNKRWTCKNCGAILCVHKKNCVKCMREY
jgi:hypothetical protein